MSDSQKVDALLAYLLSSDDEETAEGGGAPAAPKANNEEPPVESVDVTEDAEAPKFDSEGGLFEDTELEDELNKLRDELGDSHLDLGAILPPAPGSSTQKPHEPQENTDHVSNRGSGSRPLETENVLKSGPLAAEQSGWETIGHDRKNREERETGHIAERNIEFQTGVVDSSKALSLGLEPHRSTLQEQPDVSTSTHQSQDGKPSMGFSEETRRVDPQTAAHADVSQSQPDREIPESGIDHPVKAGTDQLRDSEPGVKGEVLERLMEERSPFQRAVPPVSVTSPKMASQLQVVPEVDSRVHGSSDRPGVSGSVIEVAETPESDPQWALDFEQAQREAACLVEGRDAGSGAGVLERLQTALSVARQDWNPQGRPDAQNGMIGGAAAVRVISPEDPLTHALSNQTRYGTAMAVSNCFHRPVGGHSTWYVAVGTSEGMTMVQVTTYAAMGASNKPLVEVFELGESMGSGVTSLGFSYSGERDKLLLVVGHEQGLLVVWDVMARKMVTSISGHNHPICCCCFLPNASRSPSTLLSADLSGHVSYHSLTSWVVRTSVNTRTVLEGGRGPCSIHPLTPFAVPLRPPGDSEDVGARYLREDYVFMAGEGIICMCGPGFCEVGRFWGDGRLVMFYRLPCPQGLDSKETPCVAWSPNLPNQHRAIGEGGIPVSVLAVGWHGSVNLYEVPLLGDKVIVQDPSQPDGGSRWNYRAARADPTEVMGLQQLAQRAPISVIAVWNPTDPPSPSPSPDFPVLAVHWMAPGQVSILRRQGILSQFLVFNEQLEVTEQVEMDDYPKEYVVNTEKGDTVFSHSSWSGIGSRMTVIGTRGIRLIRLMGWEECMEVLREIGKLKMALHMGLEFFIQATPKSPTAQSAHSAHLGIRDHGRVAQRLSHMLLHYLDSTLSEAHADGTEEEDQENIVIEAANIAVDLCILLQMTQVLFQDAFPRFVANGDQRYILDVLEPAIVRNELSSGVAPEVVQALVEHCCDTGQPEKVERCVLRMDIASLDLNQVIRLCLRHQLFAALLYIYSTALQDCTTPALHLVNAVSLAGSQEQAHKLSLKLLVYVRCCLIGQGFPPGIGMLPIDRAEETKVKILGFLLFTTTSHLGNALKSMQADSRRGTETGGGGGVSGDLQDPHPVLQCLLGLQAEAVVWMLRETLQDWDCVEKDLLETWSGGQVEEMESVRSVTQVVVDALVSVVGSGLGFSSVAEGESQGKASVVVEFVCECVAAGRALVDPDMVMQLLEHLCAKAQVQKERKGQLENLFVHIVQNVGVQQQQAGSYRSSSLQLNALQTEQALGLAAQAKMMQATALLHHLSGNYVLALKSFLQDKSNQKGAFQYVSKALEELPAGSSALASLRQGILDCMEEMAAVDAEAAARMVLQHFPHDQQAIIQGLQGTRLLLFKYLKGAMETALSQNAAAPYADSTANIDVSRLLTREHCTMYVGLLCEFEPQSVLSFLQMHDHLVDVEQCKHWCQEYSLRGAAAHLLEREGDIEGALDMFLKDVEGYSKTLEDTVLSGTIPLDIFQRPLSRAQSLSFLMEGRTPQRLSRRGSARDLPDVVKNSRKALQAAVSLCQRNSRQIVRGAAGRERRGAKQQPKQQAEMVKLWFLLLKVYVERLRHISQTIPPASPVKAATSVPNTPPSTPVSRRALHTITHHELRSAASHGAAFFTKSPRVALLHDLYTAFMEEIISAMADYVPLRDIVELIVVHYSNERFGDFRGTLLGLMSAYNYERNILSSVKHLINSDAFRILLACYGSKQKSYPPRSLEATEQGAPEAGELAGETAVGPTRKYVAEPTLGVAADSKGDLVLAPGGVHNSIPLAQGVRRGRLRGAVNAPGQMAGQMESSMFARLRSRQERGYIDDF